MSNGTGSTLVLNPAGLSSITFNLTGSTAGVTTYSYIVDLGRLDFNEEQRWEWVYDQNRLGGRVTGNTMKLVPLTLSVIIKAATSDYRKAGYRALVQAVMNRQGGTLQYLPEGAGAGVLDTYYHYVASPPPRLVDDPGNRWDTDAGSDGFYTLQIDIELQTQPAATSDPDNLTVLTNATTIYNWVYGGTTNRISVNAASLEGDLPALLRILAHSNSAYGVGRVILCHRTAADGTLANMQTVYEAEDAAEIAPSTAWTTVVDATRGAGAYARCWPNTDANGVAHGLRFTIQNPVDCEGRFAVFGIGYDDNEQPGVWTHQVKLSGSNAGQVGADDYYAASVRNWQVIYAGEFELPLVPRPDTVADYSAGAGPYLEWYSARASGISEFRLDAIMLVFLSDRDGPFGEGRALDVVCNDGTGVLYPERVSIENVLKRGLVNEAAYVTNTSDEIVRALSAAARGDFLTLDPAVNHLIVTIQEKASVYDLVNDNFTDYKAYYYLPILDMEADETWVFYAGAYSTTCVEGVRSVGTDSTGVHPIVQFAQSPVIAADLDGDGRFSSGDYVCLAIHVSNVSLLSSCQIKFYCAVSAYYYYNIAAASLHTGWNFVYVKKSDFASTGAPAWAAVLYALLSTTAAGATPVQVKYDLFRVEKADPDAATLPNATGAEWDFQPTGGAWTLTEDVAEDSPGATLACLDNGADAKVALSSAWLNEDGRVRGRVMAKGANGQVGIVWRAFQTTLVSGAEQCYAALIDTSGNNLNVYKYTTGSPALLDNPTFAADYNKWYTIGVEVKGTKHSIYAALSSTLEYVDSDVFDHDYLQSDFTDATYDRGVMGFMSRGTLGRFDNFVVTHNRDKVSPADTMTFKLEALFRTIHPFD